MATEFPPSRESQLVTLTQNFATKIAASPTTYSLTAPQATAYGTLSTAFVNAYNVANNDATRTPLTVELKRVAKRNLLDNLRMLARIVQNAPTTTNAMRIELGIPERGLIPVPVPPPGEPKDFKAEIVRVGNNGALSLKWKCENPRRASGTIYQVYRKVGADGEYVYLGGTGEKKFTDATIPAGASVVTYQVQGVRSTAVGPWGEFSVNYGQPQQTSPAAAAESMKIAA